MRAHGVPNFPDPTSGPNGGIGFSFGAKQVNGVTPRSARLSEGTKVVPIGPRRAEDTLRKRKRRAAGRRSLTEETP